VINDRNGWEDMIHTFKKVEEVFKCRPTILLESTGHYSENFVHFFIRNDFKVFLINPLQSHSIKSSGIRKAKTDKLDCVDIAKLYFLIDLREYTSPDKYIANLKILTRTHFHMSEQRTVIINQLVATLDQALPGYPNIFSDMSKKTPVKVLLRYSSPDSLLNADKCELIKLIKDSSRRSWKYAEGKYEMIIACAKDAKIIGVALDALYEIIRIYCNNLENIDEQLENIEKAIKELSINIPSVELLKSIPCIGDGLAPVIASEIGDISRFNNAKQLVAYCGIDPSVKQSGNFTGSKNKFTKRGSVYIRKALYIAAISSVKHKNNKFTNKILYEYYEKKIQSKAKKQAIGAIMNKLVHIIFSVLKNQREFIMITPEQQIQLYKHSLRLSA
jgi:transposase